MPVNTADSVLQPGSDFGNAFMAESWLWLAALLVFLSGVVYSIVHPERGIPDRIAGTWMVPG